VKQKTIFKLLFGGNLSIAFLEFLQDGIFMIYGKKTKASFPKQSSYECPFCKQQTAITIESRLNKELSRRRRIECTECKNRYTTYEVSESFYKQAIVNQRAVDNFIKILNLKLSSESTYERPVDNCDDCIYMRASGCDLEFPEAGGTFAADCSMFEREPPEVP
jgi:hypothetical protein